MYCLLTICCFAYQNSNVYIRNIIGVAALALLPSHHLKDRTRDCSTISSLIDSSIALCFGISEYTSINPLQYLIHHILRLWMWKEYTVDLVGSFVSDVLGREATRDRCL